MVQAYNDLYLNDFLFSIPLWKRIPEAEISLWLKIPYTIFVLFLIPVYWKHWGIKNFLWFSDVALILSVPALWLESKLLASMLAVGVLLPELYWNLELLIRIVTRKQLFGLTAYMFDDSRPLYLRLLSLFHVALPAVLIFILSKFGYDLRAVYYHTLLACALLLITYKTTGPSSNINWVFGPGNSPQEKISPETYLVLIVLIYITVLFVPSHFLLDWIFNR